MVQREDDDSDSSDYDDDGDDMRSLSSDSDATETELVEDESHYQHPMNQAQQHLAEEPFVRGILSEPSSSGREYSSSTHIEKEVAKRRLPAQQERERHQDQQCPHATRDTEEQEAVFITSLPQSYQLIKLLGRGHSGSVFSFWEITSKPRSDTDDGTATTTTKRKVAIKLMGSRKGGFIQRRTREYTAHRIVPPHDNIVQILSRDPISAAGFDYFVMELCDMSLEAWIRQEASQRHERRLRKSAKLPPALSPLQTLAVLHELLDALALIRMLGGTHRDIRPANILMKKRPPSGASFFPYQMKLADFGVADIQVLGSATQYQNYFGRWAKSKDRHYEYDDDFRSVVASVFVAWACEWYNETNQPFQSVASFAKVYDSLELSKEDKMIYEFFERALPMPRMGETRRNETLYFKDAVKRVEDLGRDFSGRTDWVKPIVVAEEGSADAALTADDKLYAYTRTTLAIVSGHRYSHTYDTSKRYLLWAEELLNMFQGEKPRNLQLKFHVQWGMTVDYGNLRSAVIRFAKLVSSRDTGKEVSPAEIEAAHLAVEEAKRALEVTIQRASEFASTPKESLPVENLRTYVVIELFKYLKACGHGDTGLRQAEERIQSLETTVAELESMGVETDEDEEERRRCFQFSRNLYLLFREVIEMKKTDLESRSTYATKAIDICQVGDASIRLDPSSRNSDRLEIGRCLCEALYMAHQFDEARENCRRLYKEFVVDTTQRVRLLRVIAIWVASLKALCREHPTDTDLSFEFGYVSSLICSIHRESAISIAADRYSVDNARIFLAPTELAAKNAGADDIFELPYLPSIELVESDAAFGLETLIRARKAIGK